MSLPEGTSPEQKGAFGNRIYPPICDPDYPLARALEAHMQSYDYIVSQPSVLNWEQGQRLLELMKQPPTPLPGALDPEAEL